MVLAPSITLHINQMRMRQRGGRQVAGRQGNRLPGGLALWFRLAMVTSRIWPEPADEGKLIARIWRGWAPQATAGNYRRHCESGVTDHLRAVTGFCGARLLRREERPGGDVYLH